MKKTLLLAALCALGVPAAAQYLQDLGGPPRRGGAKSAFGDGRLRISADSISGNRRTGETCATGSVEATAGTFRFRTDSVSRDAAGLWRFEENSFATTCTNGSVHPHWCISTTPPLDALPVGGFQFRDSVRTNDTGEVDHRAFTVWNAWLYHGVPFTDYEAPVMWLPFWYYPLDTHYGFRFMPGYRSRWGGYFLSGYVYNIYNEGATDGFSLGGSTYADLRTKNGFAVGQTVRWGLGEYGKGKFKFYHAWDEDYDRYERHWNGRRRNYRNWGSEVNRDRYRFRLEHQSDLTERDRLSLEATYLSDSHFLRDFFDREARGESIPANELWYEHRENNWAAGGSVSGPVNDFYGGTARLPEGWFDVSPQPVFDLPVNYESQTRAGYLNRNFAEYDQAAADMFRYTPYLGANGRGADYQAFRADTQHRFTLPFKIADAVSFVPRTGYRCTWWSDSGDRDAQYLKAADDALARHVAEFGVMASARATAWLNDDWRHTFEPYLDYSFQKVNLTAGAKRRYYVFDNYDRSVDWLDQFGFEGRGLPYDWHGIRPGVRNLFQRRDASGVLRTVFDADLYAAVPFEDEARWANGALRGYAKNDEDGNYARTDCAVPGVRLRYDYSEDVALRSRVEYDCDDESVAYADVGFRQRLTDHLSWSMDYVGRDHRLWDYLPSEYERWNRRLDNVITARVQHEVCDWFAWGPYIRHDCRRNDCQEVGAWIDFLTDCLGYRIDFSHESAIHRVDGSKYDADNRVVFYVYLRALGPSSALDLGRF